MMQEEKRSSASFRLYHHHNRSKSIILLHSSESISAECDSLTTYQRLSQSMRLPDELPVNGRKRKAWYALSRFFVLGQQEKDGDHMDKRKEDEKKKKKKKTTTARGNSRWSSWLPDPNWRWPVQGWS
ncbi:hypothetical protein MRB53_011318 [Persea americana]|uniref:Uncharacterized protein n=1 Tax=Persea americana TaxID=3435 RepID=A0ACC2LUN6_PERAE|nr:hypothetical protein MRB53_011318 [Persea americana]